MEEVYLVSECASQLWLPIRGGGSDPLLPGTKSRPPTSGPFASRVPSQPGPCLRTVAADQRTGLSEEPLMQPRELLPGRECSVTTTGEGRGCGMSYQLRGLTGERRE